jgi:hypothetical protein
MLPDVAVPSSFSSYVPPQFSLPSHQVVQGDPLWRAVYVLSVLPVFRFWTLIICGLPNLFFSFSLGHSYIFSPGCCKPSQPFGQASP